MIDKDTSEATGAAVNWRFFSSRIDTEGLAFYSHTDWMENDPVNRPILLASPVLTRTGAPVALCHTAKVLVRDGYTVFVLCEETGDLGEAFLDVGGHILIYKDWRQDREWQEHLARIFDILILNTLDFILDLPRLASCFDRIYWWLHESEFLFAHAVNRVMVSARVFNEEPVREVPANVRVLCVSNPVRECAEKYLGVRQAEILPFCVPDAGYEADPCGSGEVNRPVSILQAGSLDRNKGQDLLIEAIARLPESVFENCCFTFVGDREKAEPEILQQVSTFAEHFFNVRFLPSMPAADLYALYNETDIVVVSSRQESMSAIAVEAMMKGKLCVCTDRTGLTDYAIDEESILFFPSGDAGALAERIAYAVTHRAELTPVRKAARQVYERFFMEEAHLQRLKELLNI